jgi:ferrous iron transport protein B
VSNHLVAIAGNPNTGKTTLFNALTQSRAKVGNYPGVTVDRRMARLELDKVGAVDVLDIPGTYSLIARSAEEQIALDAMLGLLGEKHPDVVVICVCATQLVRGMYLTLQAQELGVNTIVALTMVDEAGESAPDAKDLAKRLECPVIPVVARDGVGVGELRDAIERAIEKPEAVPRWRWKPSQTLAGHISQVREALPTTWPRTDAMALWALMSIHDEDELVGIDDRLRAAVQETHADGDGIDDEAVEGRYRWLDREVSTLVTKPPDRSRTERADRILIHRFAGFAVFLLIMFIVFQSLFAWSAPLIGWVETAFGWLGDEMRSLMGEGLATDFVVDGMIAGVGSVIVFLPQILMLFFFVGMMEDSGYMARVAYLMDRIMKSMNLHGRAFVPMLSGFACAVPAILATRTMERRRDRLLTMMVVPLMTCSARLPVYTLVIAALFPVTDVFGVFPVQGLLMVLMYLFSTVTALAAAWIMSRTVKQLKAKRLPVVIELPPYRVPRLRDVARMMWERTSYFLREAGTVILVCTIILWALLSFPRAQVTPEQEAVMADVTAEQAEVMQQAIDGEQLRDSYGGRLGRAIEPAIEPLGFDWKMGVGIIGAFAAREVYISTMGVVYSIGPDVDETDDTLRDKIRSEVRSDGSPVYTPLVGLSLMVFFALACQCMSTLAVVRRETGGYKWPAFLFAYMTVLAWGMSFLVFQIGSLLGF